MSGLIFYLIPTFSLITTCAYRVVARYLQRHFPNRKKRGEEEVNLLQVSEGRTKRESARLFYEILVRSICTMWFRIFIWLRHEFGSLLNLFSFIYLFIFAGVEN